MWRTLPAMSGKRRAAAVHLLCSMELHTEAFVAALLDVMHRVIPSRRNLFDWADDQGRQQRWLIEGPLDAVAACRCFDRYHNQDETHWIPAFHTLAHQPVGVRGAADLAQPAFFDSGLYQEVWQPQGLHSRIEGVLRGSRGRLLGSLVLYRGPDDAAFSRADECALRDLLPAMASGLELALDRATPAAAAHGQAARQLEALLMPGATESLSTHPASRCASRT